MMDLQFGALAGRLSLPVGRTNRMDLPDAAGAFPGSALTALPSGLPCGLSLTPHSFLLSPPLGASAVPLFVVPANPLAQPWSITGGNTPCSGLILQDRR